MKILYTATSDVHLRTFHFPYLKWLKSQGYEVHVAVEKRGDIDLSFCDKIYYLPFKRSPFHPKNWEAYKGLKRIIKLNNFKLIHCHTPAVSVLTRLAARGARRKGTKVLYTAHGYHFYKGAPLKMWLLFFTVEWLLSFLTDAIILINKEDFILTKKYFTSTEAFYIKGIGIDSTRFRTLTAIEKNEIRTELDLKETDFVLLYIAEFITRKNHAFLLRAIPELRKRIPDLKVLLVGRGELLEASKSMAIELNLQNVVTFLGWRDDAHRLAGIADIGISTSRQEGLGLGLAEEMLCSVPIVASEDRGHREMIEHSKNGFMFKQGNQDEFLNYVCSLYKDKETRFGMGRYANLKAQEFLINNSLKTMVAIYSKFIR